MILKILSLVPLALLAGCEKGTSTSGEPVQSRKEVDSGKPMIRTFWFSETKEYQGIELNGDHAYRREFGGNERSEIPYAEGLKLLEEFYALPDIERFRGKKDQPRENATHHIVVIYDEKPERHSKDWVDYLIPKDVSDPRILGWLEKMKR